MEVWKTLIYQNEKYPQFSISNHGNLKNEKTGTIYKKTRIKSGYFTVCVSLGNKKKKNIKIHRAVAETFIPNPDNLPVINHKDGNKLDNWVDNLEWCSRKYNVQHAYINGLAKAVCNERNGSAKLTKNDVLYIRNNYIPKDPEFGCRALARKFKVCHKTITQIFHKQTWRNI